jgi:hypothetical protein
VYGGRVALVSGYPAMLLGLAAGLVLARSGRSAAPALTAGALVFALLVAYQSTAPGHVSEAGNVMTAPLWALLAAVNAGCWCLGIGMGIAAGRPRLSR